MIDRGLIRTLMQSQDNKKIQWYHVDATDAVLGRLASKIAMILMGKAQCTFSYHLKPKIGVIVTNVSSVKVTGNKLRDKVYHRHSGHTGNHKQQTLSELLSKDPTRHLFKAVKGMMPKNKLAESSLQSLRLYAHEHGMQAQKPIPIL